MREYFRSLKFILIIIVIAFVATSVVYFGTSMSGGGNKPNVVATVNGEEISSERFRRTQANMVDNYERMTRQRLTPDMIERLGLSQQVLNELVNEALIGQAAAREGLRVTDDELRARIQEMKEFQEDGHFSRDRYLRLLRQVRLDPGEFETELRRQFTRRKVEDFVKSGAKVSEAEVRDAYAARNQQVRAAWASIETSPLMAHITVADSDLEPFVKAHQAQFTRPERRRIQYVVIATQPQAQTVSDVDAEAYYREHTAEFEEPRRVHVAHVLVRVPPVGGSEAENKAKAKVEDVLKRARAGEDFAKLAAEVSEDTANAQRGGDLGFVAPGELVPQFEQVAFGLKKGELAPAPVRTPFGYHAIKVLDVKEGGRPPFKDVVARIKDKLATERADAQARTKADEARPLLQAAKDFTGEARRLGLDPREMAVGKSEALVGVGRDPQVEETIFALAPGGVSPAIKTTSGGYVIVKVVDQLSAGVPPLAEIRERVIDAIKRERAEALAVERAKALVATLAKGGDFLATAKADGFATGETPLFSRADPPKERNLPGTVIVAALQTPVGQVSEPIRAGSSVYLVKTLERLPADPEGFAKKRDEMDKQLLEQKRTQAWDSWLQSKKVAAKIETNAPSPSVMR
jgi:peptidyl-prolyl cis-trans isomerase D